MRVCRDRSRGMMRRFVAFVNDAHVSRYMHVTSLHFVVCLKWIRTSVGGQYNALHFIKMHDISSNNHVNKCAFAHSMMSHDLLTFSLIGKSVLNVYRGVQ